MKEKISSLVTAIKNKQELLLSKKVTAGFDGFVDTIVRVIKNKEDKNKPEFFNTTNDFGKYITEKSGSSFSLEYEEINTKLGGNMPITSNALARMGIRVNCVGALGYPQVHPVFNNLSSNCKPYSFTNPGIAVAYEFTDGKIILSQMQELNRLEWEELKNIIGIDTLINLYKESDLLGIFNWSEIDTSTNIWKGILTDVLPYYKRAGEKQTVFFDLSDCSKRSDEAIKEMLSLIKEFSNYRKVILSVNKNEFRCISEVLFGRETEYSFENNGSKIYERTGVDILLLHSSKETIILSKNQSCKANSFFVTDLVISTGAGDNFNAGFITAQLLGLDLESSLIFANAMAAIYIQSGISAEMKDVINFLESKQSN
ncbi:hypothetical protein BH10BAC2_BH10BAC2_45420 [soil metagenome]